MKINKENTEKIIKQFNSLRNLDDLIELFNLILEIHTSSLTKKKFTKKQINFFLARLAGKKDSSKPNNSLSPPDEIYRSFEIKKKSGGMRIINAPYGDLLLLLECIDILVKSIYKPHDSAYGFITGRSISDNAKLHTGKNYVYNIDLKDFFHSFEINRVKMGFCNNPFNLKDEKEPIAYFLACLTTFTIDNRKVLPQGSPASPAITNLLCWRLDHRLSGLSKRFGMDYSRYADDITFSSQHNGYNGEFQKELKRIIKVENLTINPKKTRLQTKITRQEVTGLTVNSKVNVTRKYIKEVRMYLYYCEQYDIDRATEIFRKDFRKLRGDDLLSDPPKFDLFLKGKLNFLSMVKGKDDPTYTKLENRFNNIFPKKINKVADIIALWKNEGIDKARVKYYSDIKNTKKERLNHLLNNSFDPYDTMDNIFPEQTSHDKIIFSIQNSSGDCQHLWKCHFGKDFDINSFKSIFGWQFENDEQILTAFIKELKDGNNKLVDLVANKNEIIKTFINKHKKDHDLVTKFIADFIAELFGDPLIFNSKKDIHEIILEDLEKNFEEFKSNLK